MKRKTFGYVRRRVSQDFWIRLILVILVLICSTAVLRIAIVKVRQMQQLQAKVAESVIRLHVRANSNKREDQIKKLQVRDALLKKLRPLFRECENREDAQEIILANKDRIKALAQEVLGEEEVYVSYQKEKFPLRIYGKYAFPPGVYNTLRVDIGRAEGKNWWCVLYPSLCFIDGEEEELQKAVGTSLYHQLEIRKSKQKIKIKWKIYEIFQEVFKP